MNENTPEREQRYQPKFEELMNMTKLLELLETMRFIPLESYEKQQLEQLRDAIDAYVKTNPLILNEGTVFKGADKDQTSILETNGMRLKGFFRAIIRRIQEFDKSQ